MPDEPIYVATVEKLEKFAASLQKYLKQVREAESRLSVGLARLGETWQDQEYHRFRESFAGVSQQLKAFEEAADAFPAAVKEYAEWLRVGHREAPPR